MTYLRWTLRLAALSVIGLFLHYTLPQTDIVRVVATLEERQDLGGWTEIFWSGPSAGQGATVNRDVLFIQTIRADGETAVYRNQDTGWGWPPYFKFDTADLQTEAADAISTSEDPRWYALRHYGWRNQLISIFPNALSIRPVAGPEVRIIPWFTIILAVVALVVVISIYRLWKNFRAHRIDPLIDDIDARGDRARGRVGRWFDRTFRGR